MSKESCSQCLTFGCNGIFIKLYFVLFLSCLWLQTARLAGKAQTQEGHWKYSYSLWLQLEVEGQLGDAVLLSQFKERWMLTTCYVGWRFCDWCQPNKRCKNQKEAFLAVWGYVKCRISRWTNLVMYNSFCRRRSFNFVGAFPFGGRRQSHKIVWNGVLKDGKKQGGWQPRLLLNQYMWSERNAKVQKIFSFLFFFIHPGFFYWWLRPIMRPSWE